MRKTLCILCALAALLFSSCNAGVAANADGAAGLHGLRITVDAGHGGIDKGAEGVSTGVPESELNLRISKYVAKAFLLEGADVLMTRKTDDVDYSGAGNTRKRRDMNSRAALVEAQDPQVLVSIHMNKYPDRRVKGAQVFYQKGSGEGEKLARLIQCELNDNLGCDKKRNAKPGDYFMLKVSGCPSVIVECGFLSNSDDERRLAAADYQKKLAECVYRGVCAYLAEQWNS